MHQFVRVTTSNGKEEDDFAVVEEPLQITVDGHPIAVLMRTPGHDRDLVLGFLKTESVIRKTGDVRIDLDSAPNHARVFLADHVDWDVTRLTRHLFSASSCGLCGKATIEAVMGTHSSLRDGPVFTVEALLAAPERMRSHQPTFDSTGGLHACALFDADGTLLVCREDVGRHNAVDKVVGAALASGLDFSNSFFLVSGRVSFEILQKALAADIPLVAAISAPSSLAIQFASQSNQSLVAFLRPPTFKIYSGAERIF